MLPPPIKALMQSMKPARLSRLPALLLVPLVWLRAAWRSPFAGRWRDRFARWAEYGTQGYAPEIKRRLMILNVVSYLIAFFTILYIPQHYFVDYRLWKPIIWINAALVVAALSVPFMHRFGDIAGGLMIAIAELVAMFVIVAYLGRVSGIQIQYVAFAAAPFVILGLERMWLVISLVLAAFSLHLAAWFMFPGNVDLVLASREELDAIYISAAVTTFTVVGATVYYAFRLAERAQAETDALLRNILPVSVVDRLKASPGRSIADSVESASVLFSDLKGFVPTSKALGPEGTVALLNDLMKAFDEAAACHGVEKIKTIGDAYMVASGVPEPVEDHALRLVRLGLDMFKAADETAKAHGIDLAMRIGIATGPLMAGVIGAQRLTYDVWGDTVNLAARLESTSVVGRIQVSADTRAALEREFELEPRGKVEIKGMGPLDTWLVVGPV